MPRISAVIIDDEKPARNRARYFLEERQDIYIAGEAANGEEGLSLLEEKKPALVFLDIQIPKIDGFGLLARCSFQPGVIFMTAYDEYALQAFDVNAVDYLLKPYTRERFHLAVERTLGHLKEIDFWEKRIKPVMESPQLNTGFLEQITVKEGHVFKVYPVEDIDYFQMMEGLLFLVSGKEKKIVETSLNQLEKKLSPLHFFRAHRNAVVNLKKIKELIPWGQGRLVLNFGQAGKVQVSREKIKILKGKIGLKI